MKIIPMERFKSAYNAFMGRDPTDKKRSYQWTPESFYKRASSRSRIQNERSFLKVIMTRIAVDASTIDFRHVRLNEHGNYAKTIEGSLNTILTRQANTDQTGRSFLLDAVYSMLEEGAIALFPTWMTSNPYTTGEKKPLQARVAKIVSWYPYEVEVECYNETNGQFNRVKIAKELVPIIENPFYQIMNAPNSTYQRLLRVLTQLDSMNDEVCSGKIDLLIQLPYDIKNKSKLNLAESKRKNIENQLTGNSQYGIAYIDSSEKVIQLNRSLENNLWDQEKELREELLGQMGISMTILDGSADEKVMLNYFSRIVEPIVSAISEEIERKWISDTARTQRQAIRYFRNPFKLIPVTELAEIADKLTRNEIMTSNEIRSYIGLPSVDDPRADQLINANINHPEEEMQQKTGDTAESADVDNLIEKTSEVKLTF